MSIDHKDLINELTAYYEVYSQYLTQASYQRSFGYGITQWTSQQRDLFKRLKIPSLQKNELAKHIKSAVAEFASNSPSLEVKCYNPDTDPNVVKQYQQIVKTISAKSSDAKLHAYEGMLRTGMTPGLFLSIDYDDDSSFDQSIKLEYIDYESFYFDAGSQTTTKQDGEYQGYLRRVTKEYFKRMWPKVEPVSIDTLSYTGNSSDAWVYDRLDNEVIISHHFKKVRGKMYQLYLTNMGRTLEDKEMLQPGEEIIDKRDVQELKIECYLLSANDILEEPTVYPVTFFPIVGCQGYQALIKGEIYPYSYGNEVHDMQRLQNFAMSQVGASALYLRRDKTVWDKSSINSKTQNMLLTNTAPSDILIDYKGGTKPPINWPAQGMSPSLMQLYEGASSQIDSTLGRYENSQGASGNAQMSGIAKSMEINQANLPIYYYLHPMITALNRVGEILNYLIPEIYINPRTIESDTERTEINSGEQNTLNFSENFQATDYHIYIKAGASFTIQRETYRKSMDMIYTRAPQELQLLLAPLMFELMDVPNLPRLEDIYKKFIALTQPQLFQLLKDVPVGEIEEQVKVSLEQKQQQEGQQAQMAQSMQQMAMQKEQQGMQIEQMKIQLKQQEIQLEQQKLQLQERTQEAAELENTSNYQIRSEELDQRQRDNEARQEVEQMKVKADVVKTVAAVCK